MRDLWLIRHGESLGNVDGSQANTRLSALGRRQAGALVGCLQAEPLAAVFCSPLLRARETAALALPGREPVIDDRLRELVAVRERVVVAAGLSAQELLALLDDPLDDRPAPESGAAFTARVRSFIADIEAGQEEGRAGPVVAFAHFGVIRQILGHYLGFREAPQTIAHCAIMCVQHTERGIRLLVLDQHLAGLPTSSPAS